MLGRIFQEKRADTLCYSLYLISHLDYDYYETQDNEKERGRRGGGHDLLIWLSFCEIHIKSTIKLL